MLSVLITTKLRAKPEERTSKAGKPFVTARGLTPTADDALWTNIIAFDPEACRRLLALDAGDSVALVGLAKVGIYTSKDGTTKVAIDLTADQVMSVYQVNKRRTDKGEEVGA